MTLFRPIRKYVMLALLLIGIISAVPVRAQTSRAKPSFADLSAQTIALEATYHPDSIQSLPISEKALSEVMVLESELKLWFSDAEQACYDKFFVNACLNTTKLKLREKMAIMQGIKVEAKAFQRKHRIEQLDENTSKENRR